MRSSSLSKFTQDEPNSANPTSSSSVSSPTDQPDIESDEKLALSQFRRLLAEYQRAGYEVAQRLQQPFSLIEGKENR